MQRAPKIIPALSGKGLLQISAGGKHGVASDTTRPVKGWNNLKAPSSVPKQFFSLRDIQCEAIYMRLMLLRHFSDIISKSWALLPSIEKSKVSRILYRSKNLRFVNILSVPGWDRPLSGWELLSG